MTAHKIKRARERAFLLPQVSQPVTIAKRKLQPVASHASGAFRHQVVKRVLLVLRKATIVCQPLCHQRLDFLVEAHEFSSERESRKRRNWRSDSGIIKLTRASTRLRYSCLSLSLRLSQPFCISWAMALSMYDSRDTYGRSHSGVSASKTSMRAFIVNSFPPTQ